MRVAARFLLCALLAASLFANMAPTENQQAPAANIAPSSVADLPPMPAQEREAAVSQGMLLGTMAVVLVLLAAVGGLAVYLTRRHQAAPTVKDL